MTGRPAWLERPRRDLVSMTDLARADISKIFDVADDIQRLPAADRLALCHDRTLATIFFQPSTRTRLSFESAMLLAGGSIISFGHPAMTKVSAGESLSDTLRVVSGYADVIALRHSDDAAASTGANLAGVPIVNAGCGTLEHPTQALVDLYAMQSAFGALDGLTIGLMGDLRTQRAVNSLIVGLAQFDVSLRFICHPDLAPRDETLRYLDPASVENRPGCNEYHVTDSLGSVLNELDALYTIRIDRERTESESHYEALRGDRRVCAADLVGAKPGLRIFNPLPRDDELSSDVDQTAYAWYFKQAHAGRPLRAALLSMVVGRHGREVAARSPACKRSSPT